MRKRSRWTRLLAMILAVAMVLTSQAVTALADGFMFGVVDDKGGQSDTGQTGSDSTVVPPPINQAAEETVNLPGTINGESVNLRQGPGTDYEAVTQLQSGDAVTVVTRVTVTSTEGEEQVWYRVSYGTEGAEAYVLSDFVAVSSENQIMPIDETGSEPEEENSVKDLAESYYGANADKKQTVAAVNMRPDFAGTSVKAGQTVNYRITYTLNSAANYGYADQALPLFDTYDNTVILLKLPQGLSIHLSDVSIAGVNASYNTDTGKYEFRLDPSIDAASSSSGTFSIPVTVDGNGALETNHVFDMDAGDFLSITTSFTVKDKTDEEDVKTVGTYTQTNASASTLASLTSTTDDKWGIEKSHISNTISEDKETVTVKFLLKVGLVQDGKVVSDSKVYSREGRVPFNGEFMLTETLAKLLDRDGEEIQPTSITVTENFGSKTPYEITSGVQKAVSVDTCGAHGLTDVDAAAPYYSEYYVDVVYPYEKFVAEYHDDDKNPLTVENTAKIDYTLKGGSPGSDDDSAQTQIGDVTQPAALTIEKYILGYGETGQGQLYAAGSEWTPVAGAAEFTIQKEDGSAAALYTKNADGTYTELESADGKVTIDPSAAGEDGKVTVYLDPGTYTVSETKVPTSTISITEEQKITLNAGEAKTAAFQNRELLGTIRIEKLGTKDGQTSGLNGAAFAVYADEGCTGTPVQTGTTASAGNVSGILEFNRLTPGTYYVKETGAPDGYLIDEAVWTVTISEENQEVAVSVSGNTGSSAAVTDKICSTNISNTAYLKLQKQYYWFGSETSDAAWQNVTSGNYQQFNKAFTLLRSTDPGAGKSEWETVAANLSLSADGTYLANGTGSGLPVYDENGDPYYYCFKETLPEGWHADGEADGTVYSNPVTLEEKLGHASSDPVKVTMRNTQNGTLTLTKKFIVLNSQGTKVEAKDETATFDLYKKVGETFTKVNENSYTTDASGKITVTDLPVMDGNAAIEYYWVETSAEGYLQESDKTDTITVDGTSLTAVGPFTFLTNTAEAGANLTQSASVTNVEQKVPVKIQKQNGNNQYVAGACVTIYKESVDAGNIVPGYNNVPIPDGGLVAILDVGFKYIIRETTVPAHYEGAADLTIDLTSTTVGSTGSDLREETLVNIENPSVLITKNRKDADGTTTTLAGTQFKVYTKEEDNFVPVMDNGSPVTLTAGTRLYLDAGTYYLHEVVTDDMQVLDPDKFPEQYADYDHEIGTDDAFYFGPYAVVDQAAVQDLGIITNVSSLGAVQVKKTDEDGVPLKGAVLEIYTKEGTNESVKGTATTGADGLVTFKDLPIYDGSGNQITYYIREKTAPKGYYWDGTELATTLVPGQIVSTKDGAQDGDPLTLVNKKETAFTVKKVYYDVWEHSFTGTKLSLQGAQIALYKKGTDGKYTFVEMLTTDVLGQATFEGLTQEDTYVAVEYSIPNTEELALVEPPAGKKYLSEDAKNGKPPAELTEEQLQSYNCVSNKNGADALEAATLENVINWAQIRVYKYKKVDPDGTSTDPKDEIEKVPQNHATFELYQQVLSDSTADNAALSFDEANCTLVGTYTSGTLSTENGDSMSGWFATDILDSAKHIVYWLVETDAGPGGAIIPANQYVLIKRDDTGYTNATMNGETSCETVWNYKSNQIVSEELENEAVYGPGDDHIANIRISKWAGRLDENGEKTYDEYDPLGGAKYELWVADKNGKLLEKVQDLTVGLESDINAGQKTSYVISDTLYFEKDGFEEKYKDSDVVWEEGEYRYMRMAIRESYAPGGYQMDSRTYYMIVRFVPASENIEQVHNDMYFVADGTKEIPLAENQPAGEIVWAETDDSYRLVNWPEDNFSVTVNKYGYLPAEDTLNLTAKELDAKTAAGTLQASVLSGVKMKLQRQDSDGTWKDYNYTTQNWADNADAASFTTNGSGRFTFPTGLEIGAYRIIELSVPEAYEALYNGSSINGTTAARYFDVTNQGVTVNMYNPEKISIQVKKTDLDDIPVNGMTFTLTKKGAQTAAYTANTDTQGTALFAHISTGTYWLGEQGNSLYSAEYFEAYVKETYPALADFVDSSKGINFGYTKAVKDGDVVISGIRDLSSYETGGITVQNPPLVSLTVQKTDEFGTALPGASFSIYYRPFTAFSGEQIVNTSYEGAKKVYTGLTDENGQISLTEQNPGVYYVVEDAAPAGYDKAEDTLSIYVLTGGMAVTVSNPMDADQIVADAAQAEVSFKNTSQARLTVSKSVAFGSMEEKNWSFTFSLYEQTEGGSAIGTVTLTKENSRQTFTKTLSRGKTYYLAETGVKGYALGTVKVGDTEITPAKGRYAITIPTRGDVTVTAENTYLYGQVTILKANGETGEGLANAAFQLQYADGTAVPADMVTWTSNGSGAYTAVVRLDPQKQDKETGAVAYQIVETKAPEGYIASEKPIEFSLAPGQSLKHGEWKADMDDAAMREALIMPNYNGVTFTLTKYGAVQGTDGAPQSDVTFRLYRWDEEKQKYVHQDSEKTDKNGVAIFTVPNGFQYALAEEAVPDGYVGLQGIWQVNNGVETELTATAEAENYTLYVLGDSEAFETGKTYAFHAYNIPKLELEVRKANALTGGAVPKAEISVYEVPNGTKSELTKEEAEALRTSDTLIQTVKTTKSGSGYSYMDGIEIQPGKTYLVVEDQVTAGVDSIILDDNRVVWYKVLSVPETAVQKQIVTLENIQGTASLQLTKTAGANPQHSLFERGADLIYTLTAEVGNTYALDSYVLKDTGLTAYHNGQEDALDFDTYLKNQYSITSVTLGQASHDVSMYDAMQGSLGAIQAEVTFLNFEGTEAYAQTVTVSDGNKTIAMPVSVKDKITQVTVEYSSPALQEATGYALGQNFKPGTVSVAVTLDQQTGGEGKLSIDRIVNGSEAELTYRKWNQAGMQATQESIITLKDEDEAENTFAGQKAPVAEIEKTAAKEVVQIGENAEYTLTMSNISAGELPFQDPVLVDYLPAGVTVDTSKSFTELTEGDGLTLAGTSTMSLGENTVVVIKLSGELAAGRSVSVKLTAKVGSGVVSQDGNSINNLVFATSAVKGVESQENPAAASFKNENGNWAEDLSKVAGAEGVAEEQAALLKESLGDLGENGYISAHQSINWNSGSSVTLLKENYGNLDAQDGMSYSSTRLARVDAGGSVHYRLTVRNPQESGETYTKMAVVDVLPQEDDITLSGISRYSAWPVVFSHIESVTAGGKAVEYGLYYYTGTVTASTYQAVKEAQDGSPLPSGWSAAAPADKKAITAIMIAVKEGELQAGENLTITYVTDVEDYDDVDLAEISYQNTVNNFAFHYSSYRPSLKETAEDAVAAPDILESNSVSATIVPVQVKVGGHVWIDANADGIQNDGDYSDYSIVQDLFKKISITLNTYTDTTTGRDSSSPTQQTTYGHGDGWDGAYVFEPLDAGLLTVDASMAYDGTGNLITRYLKGTNPATYILSATLNNTVGDFVLTQMLGSGISQNPEAIPKREQKDSNFDQNQAGAIRSERFYLWPTDVEKAWDNTKDIGFVLYRDLELTKTAADDPKTMLAGAEFKIYGPFDQGTVNENNVSSLLKEENLKGTYTTKEHGVILVQDLLWFKEYVIVETGTADHYELEGAVASGANISSLADQTWLLGVPNEESMVTTDQVTVTNIRKTQVSLSATKNLTDASLKDHSFTFELLAADGKTVLDKKTTSKAEGSSSVVEFSAQTVEGVGEHIFYIREERPAQNPSGGITYDTAVYKAVVTTDWNDDEGLQVKGIQYYKDDSTQPSQEGAVFTNRYEAAGQWTPEGTKTLTGRDMKQGETFTFSVREVKSAQAYDPQNPATYREVSTGSVTGGKDNEAKDITFTPVSYSLQDVGPHTYVIVETGTAGPGIVLDNTVFTVTVQVSDKKDGTLNTDVQYVDGPAAFVNKYEVQPAYQALSVLKSFEADSAERPVNNKKTFTFKLETAENGNPNNGAVLPSITEIQVTDTGSKTFNSIRFIKAGTYIFKITEVKGSDHGYTYDEDVWTATVTVEDKDAILTVTSVQYAKNGTVQSGVTAAAFENDYQVDETKYAPKVKKTVKGDVPQGSDQTFTFTLTADSGNRPDGAALGTNEVSITGSGEKSFGEITFTKAGTYKFYIQEKQGSAQGYSYDGAVWSLTVTVADQEGKLAVTETNYTAKDKESSKDQASFENKYNPTQITYQPKVTKDIQGDVTPVNKKFTFTLTADHANQEGAQLPQNTSVEVTGEESQSFSPITFKRAGTYTFYIQETAGSEPGYTYDSRTPWTLRVTVNDAGGILCLGTVEYTRTGDPSSGTEATFTNHYKVKETDYTPKVAKRLTGDPTPSHQTYEFEIAAELNPGGGAALIGTTAFIQGTGTASFGKITFTKAGTYTFVIREKTNTQPAGYTYDTSQWTLTVVVEDNDSQLTVVSHVYRRDATTSSNDQATFTNKYEVKDTSYTPKVKKEITGADTPVDKIFTFVLENAADNPTGYELPSSLETTVIGEKTGSFQAIQFTAAGEYNFKLYEKGGSEPGYTYDADAWNLYVKVEDQNSQLVVTEHTYTKADADPAVTETGYAVFTNMYRTKPAAYAPQVSKALTGDVRPSDKTFTFLLEANPENQEGAQLGENQASVIGAGSTQFAPITFTEAGTYTFFITEKNTGANGYKYDESQWTLTIEVEDVESQLTVKSHTYTKSVNGAAVQELEHAVFTNTYRTKPANYAPQVSKALTGEARPSEKIFTFLLEADPENQEGAQLGSTQASVTGAGSGKFADITFTKAGTYTFFLTEEDTQANGYEYDGSQWKLTVVVEDVDSQLTVRSHTYSKGDETDNEMAAAFENDYQVTETTYAPQIEKMVTGDTPEDETFTFTLAEDAENPEGTALPQKTEISVTGSGTGQFDSITFTKAGTYTFEIWETNGGVPGYTYDGNVWTLTVTVTDVDSFLTITDENVTYTKIEAGETTESHEKATFVNRYDTTETGYTPWISKVLTGETTPADKTFSFTLEAQEDYGTDAVISEGGDTTSVQGAGRANFGEITFYKRGTYVFSIAEVPGEDGGYTYDPAPWTLTVEVEDVDSILTIASHTYTKDGDDEAANEDQAVFTNDYQVTPTEYIPSVEKTVVGAPANPRTFTFGIAADSENPEGAVLPDETEITVEGSGSAQFGAIGFTKAGTYSFLITETAGQEDGYEYDESQWTLTVTAEDHESILEVTEAVYAKDGVTQEEAQAASFTNSYHASGALTLDNFTKTLAGSPLAAGQFTFVLADADGNVLQTATNEADGSIAFAPLTYDETDIGKNYTYTVAETSGNVSGITYDQTVYTVNVTVADGEASNGTLAIDAKILSDGQALEGEGDALPEIAFANVFSGSATLTKQGADGRLLAGAQFTLYAKGADDTYAVYAAEGNAQGIYTTGANGQLQVTNLPANDYYFVETQAPAGYVIQTDAQGEPLHYEFRIGVMDGAAGIVENAQVNAALTVTNQGGENGSIQVTKRVSQIDDNFDIVDLTAQDMTFYVGLFTDAAGTQPYGTDYIREIHMDGITVSDPVTFTGLPSGTYYVLETTEDGTPIAMEQQQEAADGSSFYCTVENGGSNAGVIDLTVSSEPGTIALQNVYAILPPEGYYWEGSLEITKRVLRDGEAVTADDTFYAGIYQLNAAGEYERVTEIELKQNDTVTVTGLSGPVGGSMTYYVFETDGNGNMISEDPDFLYSVSGEGSVTLTEQNTTGRVTITNETVDETTTVETETEETTEETEDSSTTGSKSSSGNTGGKSVKTGDTTNIMPALISLIIAGLAVIALGFGLYRRRRRDGK